MPGFPILQIQHALIVQVYDQSDDPLIDCTRNYQSFVEETGLPVTDAALRLGTDFSETTAEILREMNAQGRRSLIICGSALETTITQLAIQALIEGFDVFVAKAKDGRERPSLASILCHP